MLNLFADIPDNLPDELTTVLSTSENVRIERIVSDGHSSSANFWYDQNEHEWVLVIQGAARIVFADNSPPRELKAGDWLNIPAHQKHRVDWTSPDEPTIWLAVFFR